VQRAIQARVFRLIVSAFDEYLNRALRAQTALLMDSFDDSETTVIYRRCIDPRGVDTAAKVVENTPGNIVDLSTSTILKHAGDMQLD